MNVHAAKPTGDSLVTKKTAAERLACSVRHIERLVARGILKKVNVAGCVRFRSGDLDHLVAKGTP
jgi:excisionase family DNA binding protein